jgi:hypothetical protein
MFLLSNGADRPVMVARAECKLWSNQRVPGFLRIPAGARNSSTHTTGFSKICCFS